MAYSFWVLVNSGNLPTPAETAKAIRTSGFPLELESDWDWKGLTGWLPMFWNGSESGCEIDYEPLERKDAVAATRAGFPDLNAVLVITSRGWDSMRAACVFAGTVAHASGGCVSESEGDYIGPDEILDWTSAAVQAADTSETRDAERGTIDQLTSPKTQGKGELAALLPSLRGKVAKLVLVNESLSIALDDGSSFRGNAWKLRVADKIMDVSRWRSMKQKETNILLGDGPEKARMEAADAMQADIAKAKSLDENDLQDAYMFLKSVDNLCIESARLATPTSIEFSLTGDTDSLLVFTAETYLAQFNATVNSVTAQLSAPVPVP